MALTSLQFFSYFELLDTKIEMELHPPRAFYRPRRHGRPVTVPHAHPLFLRGTVIDFSESAVRRGRTKTTLRKTVDAEASRHDSVTSQHVPMSDVAAPGWRCTARSARSQRPARRPRRPIGAGARATRGPH